MVTNVVGGDVQLMKPFSTAETPLRMKRNTLIAGIAMIVVGFIAAWVGDSLSAVTESGILQDSILMPIGAILFVIGFLALVVAILWYLVDFIRDRLKKDQVSHLSLMESLLASTENQGSAQISRCRCKSPVRCARAGFHRFLLLPGWACFACMCCLQSA